MWRRWLLWVAQQGVRRGRGGGQTGFQSTGENGITEQSPTEERRFFRPLLAAAAAAATAAAVGAEAAWRLAGR